jgi:hypothetical protein
MVYCYVCKLHEDLEDDFQSCENCNFNLCNICYIQHQEELLPNHPYEINCFICLKKRNDIYINNIKLKIFELLLNTDKNNKINITTINKIKDLLNHL